MCLHVPFMRAEIHSAKGFAAGSIRNLTSRSSCCHFRLTALSDSSLALGPRKLSSPAEFWCCNECLGMLSLLQCAETARNSNGRQGGSDDKQAPRRRKNYKPKLEGEYSNERNKSDSCGRGFGRGLRTNLSS